MRLKTIALGLALLIISGCSLIPKQVEVITKPIQIDIVQPVLPRPIDLKEPKWYVVSDSKIIENCLKDPETKKRNCKLGKEDLYPEGYTYLDKFIDDIKKGGLTISGMSPDKKLVEYVEAHDNPFFVATQAHPEFKSRPHRPHPLFVDLIRAAKQSLL